MATRAAAAAAATAGAPGAVPAPATASPAERAGRGRGSSSNNAPPSTPAVRRAACEAAVDWDTATPVAVGTACDDLSVFTEVGVARLKVVDVSKLFFAQGKQGLADLEDSEIYMAGGLLSRALPPVGKNFGAVMKSKQAVGVGGAVGAAAFKRKIALADVGRSLLELAVSGGLLQQTAQGLFLLPSDAEILAATTPAPSPAPAPNAVMAEAISKEVAIHVAAAMAQGKSVGPGAAVASVGGVVSSPASGSAGGSAVGGGGTPLVDKVKDGFLEMVAMPPTDPESEPGVKRPREMELADQRSSARHLLRLVVCTQCETEDVSHFRFCYQCGSPPRAQAARQPLSTAPLLCWRPDARWLPRPWWAGQASSGSTELQPCLTLSSAPLPDRESSAVGNPRHRMMCLIGCVT